LFSVLTLALEVVAESNMAATPHTQSQSQWDFTRLLSLLYIYPTKFLIFYIFLLLLVLNSDVALHKVIIFFI
jgi:hypothetical protein